MTEKLKTLLEQQASSHTFSVPDLDVVRTAGLRRRRRQYAGLGAGVVAGVVAVASLAVAGIDTGTRDASSDISGSGAPPTAADTAVDPQPTATVRPLDLSYADRSTIHTSSGARVEVGHVIFGYVRTGVGYVTADEVGRVWSVEGDDVTPLGRYESERDADSDGLRHPVRSDYPLLVADRTSSLVGWIDPTGTDPAYMVADQATGEVRTLGVDTAGMSVGELGQHPDPAVFYALDRGVAYVRTHLGTVAIEVATGKQRVVDPDDGSGDSIWGVDDGTIAFFEDEKAGGSTTDPELAETRLVLGPTRAEATVRISGRFRYRDEYDHRTGSVRFSPDGVHVAIVGEGLSVFEVATGERLTFADADVQGPQGWLDDDTLVMFRLIFQYGPIQRLHCSVTTGRCRVVDPELTTIDEIGARRHVLPDGYDYSPRRVL